MKPVPVHEVAFVEFHERVADCPLSRVEGLAERVAVGANVPMTPYPGPLQESQPTTSEPQEYPKAAPAEKETLGDQGPDSCIHPSHPLPAESAFAQPVTAPVVLFIDGPHGTEGQLTTSVELKEIQPMLSLHA